MRVRRTITFLLLLFVTAALSGCSKQDGFLEDISFTLPDGVELLEYREEVGLGGGCLLSPKLREGGDGTPEEWMYTGMIARFSTQLLTWEDGGITGAAHLWNHTGLIASRSLDGLAAPALYLEAEHDLYTAAGAEKRAEQGIDPDSLELVGTYRYVLLARPEDEWGYILSLDAGSFSEDELLEFAGSFQY